MVAAMSNQRLVLGILLFVTVFLIYLQLLDQPFDVLRSAGASISRNIYKNEDSLQNVSAIKSSNKWIIVTSINYPTEDVKRLASFSEWNLVVVGDTKTPEDWHLDGVHYLSVEFQKTISMGSYLPFKSYTRKNVGYLYAIAHGAEWIYDTDDDNKPYGRGLSQFDYSDTVSGVRYQLDNGNDTLLPSRLFNPYRFFGLGDMWPRGFPLEYLKEHTNGKERLVLCQTMKRAAVQQGLVHHDPDVDAIYRLLHADPDSGLDERFNKFSPSVTLNTGTFAPWNSQNTLFHRTAFHTLFLPTTVSFRTTDIWRSYFSQKILHLSGETVAFTPVNAVQYRNSHNYLLDFEDEKQVYEQAGSLVKFLSSWKCLADTVADCVVELAEQFSENQFWKQEDTELVRLWIEALVKMDFKFPPLVNYGHNPYETSSNESTRDVNCRRMHLQFELDLPVNSSHPASRRADLKVQYSGDLNDWCEESGYKNMTNSMPSPAQIAESHAENPILSRNLDNVLIITNNYDWKLGIGLLQRVYQPYFGVLIFCGSYYPSSYPVNETGFPQIETPFNYVHINPAEMLSGYFGYHCMTLVKEMRLPNVKGYFMMSDDVIFNIWQRVDFSRVFHLTGVAYNNDGSWWNGDHGLSASRRIIEFINSTKDESVLAVWKKYENGLREQGYINENIRTAIEDLMIGKSRSVSDFFYIPSTQIDYFGDLMRIFYSGRMFHELAVNKFLRSVRHQTAREGINSYLWGNRGQWYKLYNYTYVALHPVKMSGFATNLRSRKSFCEYVLQKFHNVLFDGYGNYTMKKDDDPDYMNG